MTVQSSIILRLIDQMADYIPDRELAKQIVEQAKAQYYLDMEAQTSFVQTRIGQLELDLRDQVTNMLGNTNNMISEVLDISRRGESAATELRNDFRAIAEKVDDHDHEIASFRISRDQSIAERRQLQDDLTESKADRAAIHKELQQATIERQHMAGTLTRIEEMLNGRPSNDEARQLVEIIHATVKRVDALERRERRSNEA